jgi:hypothetical protein
MMNEFDIIGARVGQAVGSFLGPVGSVLGGVFGSGLFGGGKSQATIDREALHTRRIQNTQQRDSLLTEIDSFLTPGTVGGDPDSIIATSRTQKEFRGILNNADLLSINPFENLLGDIENLKQGTSPVFRSRIATESLLQILQDQPGKRQTSNLSSLLSPQAPSKQLLTDRAPTSPGRTIGIVK